MSCGQYTESAAGRIRVVTSGTRPTGVDRYVGQRIFESDTGRELMYDGAGWVIMSEPLNAWNTSASWTGVTGGSPSYVGDYHRSDGWCDFRAVLQFGASASSISGLAVVLPMAAGYVPAGALHVMYYDNAGPMLYLGYNGAAIGTTVGLGALDAATSRVKSAGVSSTNPFPFGDGDSIEVSGRFRMASRYS